MPECKEALHRWSQRIHTLVSGEPTKILKISPALTASYARSWMAVMQPRWRRVIQLFLALPFWLF